MLPVDVNDVASFWRWVQNRGHWLDLVPGATISDGLDMSPVPCLHKPVLDHFDQDGYAVTPVIDRVEAAAAARCVAAVHEAGIPTVFAYVYDALWTPLRPILGHLRDRIGPCEALADGWSWYIAPGQGRGWSGHRGWDEVVEDEVGRPGLVNVWVALTDLTERHSTMVVVPRSQDPFYPGQLTRSPDESLGRLLPARAGEAIYWDATVYHWGSESYADAPGPRITASYSVAAAGFDQTRERLNSVAPTFEGRLHLVASWIEAYASRAGGVAAGPLRWASLWTRAPGRP